MGNRNFPTLLKDLYLFPSWRSPYCASNMKQGFYSKFYMFHSNSIQPALRQCVHTERLRWLLMANILEATFSLYIILKYLILENHEDLQLFSLPQVKLESALWCQWWHKCWTSMKAEADTCIASSQAEMRQFPTGILEWNSMGIWIALFQWLSIIVGEYLTHLILLLCSRKAVLAFSQSVLMTRPKRLLLWFTLNGLSLFLWQLLQAELTASEHQHPRT